jgi:ATP-dependent Lon protease
MRGRSRADLLPILTLRETIVYPLTTVPLTVGREHSLRLIEDVSQSDDMVGLVPQRQPEIDVAGPEDLYSVGVLARVRRVLRAPDGSLQVWVQGLERIRTTEFVQLEPYLVARVEVLLDDAEPSVELEALSRSVLDQFQKMISISPFLPDELVNRAMNVESPRELYYLIASSLRVSLEERVKLLDIANLREGVDRLLELMNREIDLLELGQKLQSEVQGRVEKTQREYFLREQLRAIQKELGEEDPAQAEIRELREKIESSPMPEEARREAERELTRLERIPSASPEHSVIRTYLDWLTSVPWNRYTEAELDIGRARQVLDEDHYDLEKVKDRIIEYLAVRKLKKERGAEGRTSPEMREPILCFVGPPGVGKTSLGQSIARALGRKFVRMSLGGVHDEAEIRGHRRTYIGAMPGRVIQALRRAEAADPVFMLDEVEKLGADWRGDPSSALLEVLDPEQNKDFRDHYLDLPFDLSHVLFITTANTVETVHPALLDRMEVLRLPGYTEDEKLGIARRYLVPKQLDAHGLTSEEAVFPDEALRVIISDYTREAGVRNLEREIANVVRKTATTIAEAKADQVEMDADRLRLFLGKPKFFAEAAERIDRPGVATGLVYTPAGGDIIFVEANAIPGRKELRITGQLGDVMRESAEAALSFVRSRAERLGLDPKFFEEHDIHIHVPGGAVPKDGPSAGVTLVTALASVLSRRLVRSDIAMTGEITLRGKVLPIGGVKEKVLGAHRAGIHDVILPHRNEADLDELTEELRREMHFHFVENVDQVLDLALERGHTGNGMPSKGDGQIKARKRARKPEPVGVN